MKKTITFFIAFCLLSFSLFCQDKKNSWKFDLTTDVVYYPFSDFIPGSDHFSPISGPLDTMAIRITGEANYIIPLELGDHWLFDDAHLTLQTGLQILPVTMRSINRVIFSPVPFLEFEAGTSFGIGWNFGNVVGLAAYDETLNEYVKLSTLKNWYYDFWGMGTFMFDTGAVIPGDWTHVVMLAQYQIIYKGITGIDPYKIYNWQTVYGETRGLQYDAQIILAYQMPIVLYRAGIMSEFSGHYNSDDYGIYSDSFGGDFTTILLSPFLQFKFENEDTFSILFQFSNRRSFEEEHSKLSQEITLTKSGQEWFFNMLAVSWTHHF